jgi:heme oxygenase
MLGQHYFVYQVLEEAADFMRSDLIAGPFVSDRLPRLPALESDLRHYLGENWAKTIRPSAATKRYQARLREVCFDWPGGFVAHHYTRYLADLSGGQAIRSITSRRLGSTGGEGFAFLTFDDIPNKQTFKNAYRTLLDTAGWDAGEQQRIIAEVRRAYRLNVSVLDELGRRLSLRIPVPRR